MRNLPWIDKYAPALDCRPGQLGHVTRHDGPAPQLPGMRFRAPKRVLSPDPGARGADRCLRAIRGHPARRVPGPATPTRSFPMGKPRWQTAATHRESPGTARGPSVEAPTAYALVSGCFRRWWQVMGSNQQMLCPDGV